jgi:hypothetical protein
MSSCPTRALFPLRKKRTEMSARADAKECCLGASFIGMAFPRLLTAPGTAGEVLEKDLGSTRNSKKLIVEWEQPRLQLRRGVSKC